jgi:hypothetical protein
MYVIGTLRPPNSTLTRRLTCTRDRPPGTCARAPSRVPDDRSTRGRACTRGVGGHSSRRADGSHTRLAHFPARQSSLHAEPVSVVTGRRRRYRLRSSAASNRNRESRVVTRHEWERLQRPERRVPLETQGRERRDRRHVQRGVQDALRCEVGVRARAERIPKSQTGSAIRCQKTGSEKIGETFFAQKKLVARRGCVPPVGVVRCSCRSWSRLAGVSGGLPHRRPLRCPPCAGSRSFRPTGRVP